MLFGFRALLLGGLLDFRAVDENNRRTRLSLIIIINYYYF